MKEGEPLPDEMARIYRLEGLSPDEQWKRAAEIHTIGDRMADYAPVIHAPGRGLGDESP